MRRLAFVLLLLFACRTAEKGSEPAPAAQERTPPSVLMGKVKLDCAIDWERNGRQLLTLVEGAGLEFEATVSPIVDGTATLKGEKEGGEYRFSSHLAEPATGKLSGVGEVKIEKMDTKVSVAIDGYEQKGGPGKPIAFRSEHLARRGIYVEFSGQARAANGDKYGFKVNLGGPTAGSGEVKPSDENFDTRIVAKAVIIEAEAVTSVVQSETTVEKLP
jgi:hypothetical protein